MSSLGVINGDPAIFSDWIGADEHEREYLIIVIKPVFLGRTMASAAATGEVCNLVNQGTYPIGVSAPGQQLSYDLTIVAVPE